MRAARVVPLLVLFASAAVLTMILWTQFGRAFAFGSAYSAEPLATYRTLGHPVNWTCSPRDDAPMVDAFLILTHANHTSSAAVPLIRKLLTSDPLLDRLVVLHVDTANAAWVPIFKSMFGNYSNFHVISKRRGAWGQVSLVHIMVDMMEDALNTEYCSRDNHTKCCWNYVHVLSGDTYLLQSVAEIGERMRKVWPTNYLSFGKPEARVAEKLERRRVNPKWHGYTLLNTSHVLFGFQVHFRYFDFLLSIFVRFVLRGYSVHIRFASGWRSRGLMCDSS
eukprot:TRINITY_DN2342_c0_g2_i5.p1 TRINITY_DN2342_c0_g2~~TRINITY_DN2342_c0_g2_i5.p1  ORF type:complete len:287 (+),score=43.13 TRINITY_DN2342_c0_g2_i5:28-861(+)